MQTRSASAGEAAVSTSAAILLSLLSYQFILGPLLGFEVTYADNIALTGYFTVLSFARIYLIRRWNEWRARSKDAKV